MPRYLSLHSLPTGFVERDQLELLAQYGQRDGGVKGIRTLINLTLGKLVCVFDADNQAAVADYFARIGFPVDSIMHVEYEDVGGSVFAMPPDTEQAASSGPVDAADQDIK